MYLRAHSSEKKKKITHRGQRKTEGILKGGFLINTEFSGSSKNRLSCASDSVIINVWQIVSLCFQVRLNCRGNGAVAYFWGTTACACVGGESPGIERKPKYKIMTYN